MGFMGKTAIILGVTGLTGGYLLAELLADKRYEKVILFSRRTKGIDNPKVEEHLITMSELISYKNVFKANDVFCCVGTTQKKTPDKEVYRSIDYNIPVQVAALAADTGADSLIIISSVGANAQSKTFYTRLKGEMEEKVATYTIPNIRFVRPALINAKREEFRLGELFFKGIMKVLDYVMVGSLEKYRSIHPKTIAKAMVWLANNPYQRTVVESDVLQKLGAE